jgi:hypothetical protein
MRAAESLRHEECCPERMRIQAWTTLLAVCGVACGGSNSTLELPPILDGGSDAAVQNNGDCIVVTEGEACAPSDLACQPASPCCAGYEWACNSITRTWQQAGLSCPCADPPHGSGPTACEAMTCPAGDYCLVQPPGINNPDGGPLPTSYSCQPPPSSCGGLSSCTCIDIQNACDGAPGSCSETGGVVVSCVGE